MRIALLLLVLLSSSVSVCQIPNAGFEFWATDPDSNLNPVGWQTTNSFPLVTVERVSPGCVGNYAMKVKTVNIGFPFPGIAILQTALNIHPRPTRFSALVRATIMPGDTAFIILGLMNGDSVIASVDSCRFKILTNNNCTCLEFPIRYQSPLEPDSLVLMVTSGLAGSHVGTELTVDEISFNSCATSVTEDEGIPATFSLHQNYPNPFNPSTVIDFDLPTRSHVTLKVFDVLGREVATLVNQTRDAGYQSAKLDANGWASGVYFYRLQAGDFTQTKRLMLIR